MEKDKLQIFSGSSSYVARVLPIPALILSAIVGLTYGFYVYPEISMIFVLVTLGVLGFVCIVALIYYGDIDELIPILSFGTFLAVFASIVFTAIKSENVPPSSVCRNLENKK